MTLKKRERRRPHVITAQDTDVSTPCAPHGNRLMSTTSRFPSERLVRDVCPTRFLMQMRVSVRLVWKLSFHSQLSTKTTGKKKLNTRRQECMQEGIWVSRVVKR